MPCPEEWPVSQGARKRIVPVPDDNTDVYLAVIIGAVTFILGGALQAGANGREMMMAGR